MRVWDCGCGCVKINICQKALRDSSLRVFYNLVLRQKGYDPPLWNETMQCTLMNIHDVAWKINPPEPGHKGSDNHQPPEEVHFHRIGEPWSLCTIGEPGGRAAHTYNPGRLVGGDISVEGGGRVRWRLERSRRGGGIGVKLAGV